LGLLSDWSANAQDWRRILVDNPQAVYGFAA